MCRQQGCQWGGQPSGPPYCVQAMGMPGWDSSHQDHLGQFECRHLDLPCREISQQAPHQSSCVLEIEESKPSSSRLLGPCSLGTLTLSTLLQVSVLLSMLLMTLKTLQQCKLVEENRGQQGHPASCPLLGQPAEAAELLFLVQRGFLLLLPNDFCIHLFAAF